LLIDCLRVEETAGADRPEGAIEGTCALCAVPIVLSPTTQQALASGCARAFCSACIPIAAGGQPIELRELPGQVEELRRHLFGIK
jgi:hypothetical protein